MSKFQTFSLLAAIVSYASFTFFCLRAVSEGAAQPINYILSLCSLVGMVFFLSVAWIVSLKQN